MTAKKYWLLKSEPEVYSILNLARDERTEWEGVRSYPARLHLRAMSAGDLALYYHSATKEPGVAGICRISTGAEPDPTQFDKRSRYYDTKSKREDPRWDMVTVEHVETLAEPVSLKALKEQPKLADMALFKMSRLSVQPVTPAEMRLILKLGRAKTRAG